MIWLMLLGLFSFDEVVRTDLITHGKIRWSKLDGSERVTVEIDGGNAMRTNPNWSPQPQKLAYDLGRQRELQRVIKSAKLSGARKEPSPRAGDRTLEVLVEDGKGWHSAGFWSMSVKAWQKGRFGAIFDALEPLLDVKPELFDVRK
jgi:hypothetical protein